MSGNQDTAEVITMLAGYGEDVDITATVTLDRAEWLVLLGHMDDGGAAAREVGSRVALQLKVTGERT